MKPRITVITVCVDDPERSIRFYRDVRNKLVVFILVLAATLGGVCRLSVCRSTPSRTSRIRRVIVYSRWDRSPDVVEDQVTYPIVAALLGAPKVKTVRGFSDFGYSYVYAVFEEGTDIYWARSRTLQYLSGVLPGLPQGVKTELGPDATGLGWIFQYVLVDTSGKHSLADLRAYQDWTLPYHLRSVPGVAEVAAIGGFGRQYQINVDPNRLQAYGIPISRVVEAVRGGNAETGGRLIEFGGTEYMVRGRGYAKSLRDFALIRDLRPPGIGVLVLDYRGYGESSGKPTEAGIYRDAEAAWGFLGASQPEIDRSRIAAYGRSLGTAAALHVAVTRRVRSVVLHTPFTNARDLARLHYWYLPRSLLRLELDNLDRARRLRTPLLVIHGTADDVVPIEMGRAVAEAGHAREFVAVQGAGHNDLHDVAGDRYREKFQIEPEAYAAYGYEAGRVTLDAIARAGCW